METNLEAKEIGVQNDDSEASSSPKRYRRAGKSAVTDVLLCDRTGPVLVTLWDDLVDTFLDLSRDGIASQEKSGFLFEGLRCSTLQK